MTRKILCLISLSAMISLSGCKLFKKPKENTITAPTVPTENGSTTVKPVSSYQDSSKAKVHEEIKESHEANVSNIIEAPTI